MMNYKIKTVTPSVTTNEPHFYLLRTSSNAGKPMNAPSANCFIVICENDYDRDSMYWFCFALWQTRIFEKRLIGSVIPFLRIGRLLWTLDEYIPKMTNNAKVEKSIAKLRTFQAMAIDLKNHLAQTESAKKHALENLLSELPHLD